MTCDSLRQPLRGVGRVCETLMPELVRQGAEVVPLDARDNPLAQELSGRPCAVIPASRGPARTARWHATLSRRVAKLGIGHDVLLSTAGFPHVFSTHPRLAVLVHDLHMLEPGFYQPGKRLWFRAFLQRGLRNAALRICVSQHTRRELEHRFPELDKSRNVVVHNAVPDQFAADSTEIGSTRDGTHFLFVGQLERRKNLARLLVAYTAARGHGVERELHLVGRPGPGGDAILTQAAQLDGVRVHTDADDAALRSLYADAHAVLLPSLHEGFGIPAIEGMQAGAPVLVSKGTALEEVAADAALCVDPANTAAIRDGIVQLDRDAELRSRLIERGTRRCADFTPRAQAAALLEALGTIC